MSIDDPLPLIMAAPSTHAGIAFKLAGVSATLKPPFSPSQQRQCRHRDRDGAHN
ncbi:MAG TPA: hypothetical protein VGS13_13470 [Stellaceae bacterium]|nr:hypothetical protein [Stellaceae bacterium]